MAYECVSHICSAICSCLLGFNFRQEQRSTTPQIQTPSVTPNTEEIPPSASTVTTNTEVIPSSSSSPSASPLSGKITYDVFLSFRGEDTRTSFTDHLYTALTQKGINTFRDDEELKRGESIGPNLLKAIEESRYAVVVFSQNYADSTWCLDEIVKAADCMKTMGRKVLPVFYHIDPSEVRKQTGDHFGKAFEKHQERFQSNPDKVQRWKDALLQVGNLTGWHLKDGYESITIQKIVEKIFTELNHITSISEGLVGMDSRLNEMLHYIGIGCPDVRIIGICGMGGIGKTTIAQAVFEGIKTQFDGCIFLENVREIMAKQGAVHLQEQLLSGLLKCSVNVHNTTMGKKLMKHRLGTRRVLLVLDDVDKDEQLEALCDRESFGPGSRIIITTRDKHLLRLVEEDELVYNVNPLTDVKALELFSMKAFKKGQPVGEEFLELSKEFLKYADGHPLAIKVLGSSVKGRSVQLWSSALDRLKKAPNKRIISVLKVSYDALEPREQKIFLDIACFFKGEIIDSVTRILQGSNTHRPDIDLEVLQEKSMVTVIGKKLWMHDLLQELGWELVRQECPEEELGKRSRLWDQSEIIDVFHQKKATNAVQSIDLRCPEGDISVHSIDNALTTMQRLRLLKICKVNVSGNITYLSNDLQYLHWCGCPLNSFPSDFQPDKLVEVHMKCGSIKHLWTGKKEWRMLQLLDVSSSHYLTSTPDFTEVPKLEKLVLEDCTSLVEIHPSLGSLKKLRHLNMRNCRSVESIPPFTGLESLETLDLSFCSGLEKFPEVEGNMKSLLELRLHAAGIEEFPAPSIEHLTGLILLDLSFCVNLLHLPKEIQCLTYLKELKLVGCFKVDEINLNGMKSVEKLSIGLPSVRELSFTVGMKSLHYLSCGGCISLGLVPEACKGLASLSSLTELDLSCCHLDDGAFLDDLSRSLLSLRVLVLGWNYFVRLPESLSQFSKLDTLKLSNCRQLESLPEKLPLSLRYVYADNCTSLTDYPNQIKVLTSPGRVTIINSLESTDSSALLTISRSVQRSIKRGLMELHSEHKYTDGKVIDHYFPLRDLVYLSQFSEAPKSTNVVLAIDEMPEWFGDNITTRDHISIPIPQNGTSELTGIFACAVFSVKGHTAHTIIEPDPNFSNYSFHMTFETDVTSAIMKSAYPQMGSFGCSSHVLAIFHVYCSKVKWLKESSVVKAIFETTNPSMVVQKCAIRPVYGQDDGWGSRIIPSHAWASQITHFRYRCGLDDDVVHEELASGWFSSEPGKWEKIIPPMEEESTVVLRKNLESVLPRYLEALDSNPARFKFNLTGSPGWFLDKTIAITPATESGRLKSPIELPENLHKSKKWMGFVIFASLVEEVRLQALKDNIYEVLVGGLRPGDESAIFGVRTELEHVRPLSEEHHQLIVMYIPRAQIPEAFFIQTLTTAIDFCILIQNSSHVKVQRIGFRIVYQKDIQGFADTIIQCIQREGSLEFHNKLVVQEWMQLIRLRGAPLQRMTERDSRTPRQKYFDLHSRKYRNWDWSDRDTPYCSFERVDMSKWERFMPLINQGNSAEIQLPVNVFDDDNWLGFAVCCWLSHDQYPNISLGADIESDNVMLHFRLHSDIAWNGLYDYEFRLHLEPLNLTWFCYIPRMYLYKIWRQCKLIRATMSLINCQCLTVHSCALRLVYKEDVEHLVQTLTLAELP